MRIKSSRLAIASVLMFSLVFVQDSYAQGLFGKGHVGFQVGQVRPGDDFVRDIDDSVFIASANINLPLNENLDAGFSLSYSKLDGRIGGVDVKSEARGFFGGLRYHFVPAESINPYLGASIGIVRTEFKPSSLGMNFTDVETDFGYSIETGLEISLGDMIAIRPSIQYINIDIDDFVADLNLNIWFDSRVFALIGSSYGFDDGDIAYYIGLGFGF